MRQFAQVVSVLDNEHKVEVVIKKHSACGKCGGCHKGDDMKLIVDNDLKAKLGDMVILEMKESNLLNAALFIYLLPLVGLVIGYLAGVALGIDTELGRIGLGFLLFLASFLIARGFGKVQENKYNLKLTGILD
ncbi:RseC/MucC-like positive regulator of sigma(E) [Orenia metallireducens]|jgi:sigma-E factor negative regulatory protein RseC|uniref:Positive regulator of sigma(E), RseC/MucC n=1 Tax=Orenia metallireducens TaxID=1413210 RepID=A0A285H524_9FIRM|nr:SoxR reducing system RseC family protein [Orenia metallireducens]PRX28620.1 RseC/MucC-like positive regulator of sigma(E) [Orenia metallireducens]SNY30837.1 positive regulator of sigma(E), RseC/MucC [Orenia metallireducens]